MNKNLWREMHQSISLLCLLTPLPCGIFYPYNYPQEENKIRSLSMAQ